MNESGNRRRMARRDWLQLGIGAVVGGGFVGAALQSAAGRANGPVAAIPKLTRKDWRAAEFRKMVALGESTTAGGWSTSPERCWVPVLAALINDFQSRPMEFFNAGIGANVISTRSPSYEHSGKPAALVRLEKHVLAREPDLLIISYGLNDARGGTPRPLFREEMTTLVRRVRERIQPVIVLLGPYYMTGFDLYGPHWNNAALDLFRRYSEDIGKLPPLRIASTSIYSKHTVTRIG